MKRGAAACVDPGGCACPSCLARRAKELVRARPWLAGTVDTSEEDYASPGYSRRKPAPADLLEMLRASRKAGQAAADDAKSALVEDTPRVSDLFSDLPAPGLAWQRAREIGLNWTQFGRYERDAITKFGSDDEQAEDCVRLGATILRRVGTMDLTWANLSYDQGSYDGKVGREVPVDPAQVRADIDSTDNRSRIATFLSRLHGQNLKVILTCFLWEARAPTDDYDDWTDLGFAEPLRLRWHPGHRSNTDFRTHYDGNIFRWNYDFLNLQIPYQVDYLTYMAEGIGDLLRSGRASMP